MASTTSCPTVNATTPCPTTGYRFEPTGTYNPTPSNWYNTTPFDVAPFFPPTKTYSSIFNKDTTMPSPMVNMPMMPPMMMPTSPVPTTMPPMMPPMTPVMTPFMTPVTPMTCPVPVPVPVPTAMPSWCYSPMTTPVGLPTTFPMTYPTVTPMTPTYMPFDAPMTTPFGMPTTYPMMSSTTELCSVGCRPSNPVELYCLTNPIRVCDREGNRMLCLNFDFRGYKPEEITVTLNKTERCITIEATHEVKEGKEHHVMRKFSRKFVLPTELAKIDLAKCEIKSCLTVEGCLCIEMPLPKMTTEEIAKCPIMSRAAVSPLFNTYYKCPSVVYDTKPVACKIN